MNLADLRDRLRRSIKNPEQQDVPDTILNEYLNDGYRDVFSRFPFHQARKICTFLTTPGEAKYQLPADISAVLSISNRTTGRKIRKGDDDRAIDRLDNRPWRPQFYVRYRNYLRLVPVPDAVYVIAVFYKYIPVLLAADADIPSLPEDWHPGIMLRAKWYYYVDTGDLMQSTSADNSFKLWALDKPTEIEEETEDMQEGVRRPESSHLAVGSRSYKYDDGTFDYGLWG